MGVSVTVIGSSGGYSGAGKACSSYLLRNGSDILVLDIGSGALSNLLKYVDPDDIRVVVISHMHYDHYADLYGLLTARRFWKHELPPLDVITTYGVFEKLAGLITPQKRDELRSLINLKGFNEDVVLPGFELRAAPGRHACESWIIRIAAGAKTICYSGDTEMCDNLIELAHGVDLFICDSTFTGQARGQMEGHLTALGAGEAAAEARVGHLILTHLWPTLSEARAVEEARSRFNGKIDMAREGMRIEL